ncbi:MAG: MFS transporter [Desulfovibrio sp.]
MHSSSSNDTSLLTPEFCILMGIAFLAFCNISLFYGLNAYLESQQVSPLWRGILLGLEPCTALILRPLVSPFLTVRNSLWVTGAALFLLMAALCSYAHAHEIWTLALVRIAHGLGFVLLVSALVTILVAYIPPERSGQGFGIFAIASLLPYAVLPPVVERLLPLVGSEPRVYALFTPALALALLPLPYLGRRTRLLAQNAAATHRRPQCSDIRKNLHAPGIRQILVANGLVFTATTVVVFFMKDRLMEIDMHNVGLFFSVSTAATIGVRIFCGKWMDRVNRGVMLAVMLTALAGILALFSVAGTAGQLYMLAGLYGICLGFALPQLNAVMFVISPPHLRGLNTNLMMFTMDAGYVLGPLLAGELLHAGIPTKDLFACFAAAPLLSAFLAYGLVGLMRPHAPETPRAAD